MHPAIHILGLLIAFFIAVGKGRVVREIIIKIGEAERKKEGGVSMGSNIRSTRVGVSFI